tara:strand:- start:8466 stop:8675 length:210 start_codon:yes stop_codon:yes gene_type:complete
MADYSQCSLYRLTRHDCVVTNPPTVTGWQAFALTAGLRVAVQGFETSRYLGAEYDAQIRIRSLRLAQWA